MPTTLPDTKLADELKSATTQIVEHLANKLAGRTFSPRIKLLTIDDVVEATRLGASTIDEMVRAGKFPKPQSNVGKRLWREATLIAWCDANDPNKHAG